MSILPSGRSAVAASLAITLLVPLGACRPRTAPVPEQQPVRLIVRNNGFFDVNVHVLRAPNAVPVRIGTVSGLTSRALSIPQHELQPGAILTVRLHAIGTNGSWESPSLLVGSDLVAHLEIFSDGEGDMRRSYLFTTVMAASP